MDRERLTQGTSGIPPDLERSLPWWLRYRNGLFIVPLSVGAIAVMVQGNMVIGAGLLALSALLLVVSFWVVKAWLSHHGHWIPGTWHAEVLPSIHRLRGVFVATFVVAGAGCYLVLAAGVRSTYLTAATVLALVLIVPVYVCLSLVQGFMSSGMGDISFRDEEPARFWIGLCTYAAGMAFLVAIVGFFVIEHGT
jgi:hypothetical protein